MATTKVQFKKLCDSLREERLRYDFFYQEIDDRNKVIAVPKLENTVYLKDGRRLTYKDFEMPGYFKYNFQCVMTLHEVLDRRIY
jgi:hypothetical protein